VEEQNNIKCPACGFENSFYSRICLSCKNYLRDRVVNIDLWSILGLLIENPFKAFQNIIYSEHKNFILFLIPLITIKYLFITRLISLRTIGEFETTISIVFSFLILLSALITYILLFSLAVKIVLQNFGYSTRFKDNLAVIIYSQLLMVCGFIVLFPLEAVIFGNYLFSINPSPFQIKTVIAYFFFSIELIVILWSFFLLFTAFYVSTKNKAISVLTTLVFILLLSIIIIFSSKVIFAI
jgi:hypothetical protein